MGTKPAIDLQRYKSPGPVGTEFLNSLGPIDTIMGPAGSGKTVASVYKGPKLAAEYLPVCKDGWVRVRVACNRCGRHSVDRTGYRRPGLPPADRQRGAGDPDGSAMIAAWQLVKGVLGSRTGLGALLCLAVVLSIWIYGETRWRDGYAAYEQKMADAAAQAERDRVRDETRLKGLSDHDLCADYLGARGLSLEACNTLRGFPGERPEPGRDSGAGKGRPPRP